MKKLVNPIFAWLLLSHNKAISCLFSGECNFFKKVTKKYEFFSISMYYISMNANYKKTNFQKCITTEKERKII